MTPKHEPTPEEIRRACERLQREWTEQEREKRRAYRPSPKWEAPVVRVCEFSPELAVYE